MILLCIILLYFGLNAFFPFVHRWNSPYKELLPCTLNGYTALAFPAALLLVCALMLGDFIGSSLNRLRSKE